MCRSRSTLVSSTCTLAPMPTAIARRVQPGDAAADHHDPRRRHARHAARAGPLGRRTAASARTPRPAARAGPPPPTSAPAAAARPTADCTVSYAIAVVPAAISACVSASSAARCR